MNRTNEILRVLTIQLAAEKSKTFPNKEMINSLEFELNRILNNIGDK